MRGTVVAIAGKFDPVHEGHIDHILKATKLGDYLLIITHNDESVAKFSKKGKCAVALWARKMILEGIIAVNNIRGRVVVAEENGDSTNSPICAGTLRKYKPNIFAKGGDRTPDNMPKEEIEVCKEIGCRIVYGTGDLLNSSSTL